MMKGTKVIKMDGAGFTLAYVLSFKNQTEFINANKENYYTWHPLKIRKRLLRTVYKLVEKM